MAVRQCEELLPAPFGLKLRLPEHPPPGFPGSQHPAFQRPPVERRVLRLARQLARLPPARSAPGGTGTDPPARPSRSDPRRHPSSCRRPRRSAARWPACSVRAPLCTCASVTAEQRRQPGAARRRQGERQPLVVGVARLVVGGDGIDRAIRQRRRRPPAGPLPSAAAATAWHRCGNRRSRFRSDRNKAARCRR